MLAQLLRGLLLPDEAAPSSSPSTTPSVPKPAPSPPSNTIPNNNKITYPSRTALPPAAPLHLPSTQPPLTPFQRQAKQLSFLLAGVSCMAASVFVTRRAVLRRQRESIPRFFHASNDMEAAAVDSGGRQLLAVQAFGLATLNVTSFGVLLTGGMAWAFDLCSIGELRQRTQEALARQAGEGMLNAEDEKAMEEMMEDLMNKLGMEVPKEKEAGKGLDDAEKK